MTVVIDGDRLAAAITMALGEFTLCDSACVRMVPHQKRKRLIALLKKAYQPQAGEGTIMMGGDGKQQSMAGAR